MSNKPKYALEINWNKADLVKFLSENKIKMLNYLKGRMDSHNKVIQGDGVDALSSLIISGDKFEIVMIDPPYNENKSKGKYKDQWRGSGKDFNWAGENHGAYLDFLYPRIILGKEILSEDGVMMLFIGDGEQHYVRILMDKIFGEGNYVGTVIWDSSSNQQKSKPIDRNHEYVLIFAKNINAFSELGFYKVDNESLESKLYQKAQELKSNNHSYDKNQQDYSLFFKQVLKESKQSNKSVGNFKYITPGDYIPFYCDNSGDPRDGNKTILKHPITKKDCPLPADGKGWRYSQDYINRIAKSKNIHVMHDGRVLVYEQHDKKDDIKGLIFGKDETGVPNTVRSYSVKTDKKVMTTTGYSFKGDKKEGIDPKTGFETVKPTEFLSELILNYPNKKARVIDYFAGSGSTAVAVEEANKIDSGSREWTLIEINETTVKNVLIPKLKHFEIQDFKHMNVTGCNLTVQDVDVYFRKFMSNYIQSEREYIEIHKDSNLGYTIVGVEGETLILSSLQKEESDKAPRPSLFSKEIQPYITKHNCKKVFVYMVGTENFKASWEVLIKDTVSNNNKISSKDIKIMSLPNEMKTKWENLIDSLSQYEDKKK